MALRLEDYALLGDTHTAALSGGARHGRWTMSPAGGAVPHGRRYRGDSLVLETELTNDEGTVPDVDCMPIRPGGADVSASLASAQGPAHRRAGTGRTGRMRSGRRQ